MNVDSYSIKLQLVPLARRTGDGMVDNSSGVSIENVEAVAPLEYMLCPTSA